MAWLRLIVTLFQRPLKLYSLFRFASGREDLNDCHELNSYEEIDSSCRDAFDAAAKMQPSNDRAPTIDELHPDCRCEACSVSKYSSGRVESDEILIRVLVAPQHIDKKKNLPKLGALADAEKSGLSVFREGQVTNEEIRSVAIGLVERARAKQGSKADEAGVFGVLRMTCSVIRACKADIDVTSSYCVYDTAEVRTPSHAEVFQRVHSVDDGLRDERRRLLFDAVKREFVPVDRFRDGLLIDLAPKTLRKPS